MYICIHTSSLLPAPIIIIYFRHCCCLLHLQIVVGTLREGARITIVSSCSGSSSSPTPFPVQEVGVLSPSPIRYSTLPLFVLFVLLHALGGGGEVHTVEKVWFLSRRTRVLGPGHVGYIVVGASLRGVASSVRVGDTVRLTHHHHMFALVVDLDLTAVQ